MKATIAIRVARLSVLVTMGGMLLACAGYTPKPLPANVHWNASDDLRVDAGHIALPALATQRVDLNAPLTIEAVAALAVLNDPALELARDQAGVAHAQAFAAGLLPDPQLSASRKLPRDHGRATRGYRLGLSMDLEHLITRGVSVSAARAKQRQVDLQILWQEWQVASAAESDYIVIVGLHERAQLLRAERDDVLRRLRRDRAEVASGLQQRAAVDTDWVDLQRLERHIGGNLRQQAHALARLDELLGLRAGTPIRLGALPRFDAGAVQQAVSAVNHLSTIRPDLLALQAGYRSQEQELRKAVLSQFPSISVGLSRARGTDGVRTLGLGITMDLPILNGSRGQIAVERATRQALYDAYIIRLRQTRDDVAQRIDDIRLLERQRTALQAALPALREAATLARVELNAGDATLSQAAAHRRAFLDQRLMLEANAQQLAEQTVALQLLTGDGVFALARQQPAKERHLNRSGSRRPPRERYRG